ncbi:hypothetical protein BDA96_05G151600 [Sorghum bicolor]|uniref:F-box domain-containing protein n=1 Tax=Sorghum bicolor TaxID=4558 RepID=A0A921QY40_SORBI|nr:hypothetical protein BDA96_05G151600 [Sorghum bicolor]
MAAGKARKRARQAAPASDGGDRIGALPDETLHHVLSFLPAQEAVRTCVLARRWLHLWKSATGLRIVGANGEAPVPFEEVREFVDSLLLLRGSSPLETFELRVAGDDIDVRHVRLWVRYAVQCKAQVLRLSFLGNTHVGPVARLRPDDPPLASRHLTKLELRGLVFNDDFLDFSRCPELQDLHIQDCSLEYAERISSQSLRHLYIRGAFNPSSRAGILAPNLASLVLEVTFGMTPVIQKMPLLVKGTVGFRGLCEDLCSSPAPNYVSYVDCDKSCRGCIRDGSACVILCAVSQAEDLVLIASPDTFIFRRDLKGCPTFNRLKSLCLDENWCVPDEYPLSCILELSPVLEKLAIILYFKIHLLEANVQIKGRFNPKELPPTISSHLKEVEILCGGVDGNVLKVLRFLSKLNISFSFPPIEA